MHELGLIQEVLDIVAEESKGARVRRVVLEVGALAMVLPDALRFAFELARVGTVAEDAALEVKEVPARARCRRCDAVQNVEQVLARCACGSQDLEWLAGEELRVVQMELS